MSSGNNLGSRLATEGMQGNVYGVSAIGAGNAVCDVQGTREFSFEVFDMGSANKGGFANHRGDRRVDFGFDRELLCMQISKGYGRHGV